MGKRTIPLLGDLLASKPSCLNIGHRFANLAANQAKFNDECGGVLPIPASRAKQRAFLDLVTVRPLEAKDMADDYNWGNGFFIEGDDPSYEKAGADGVNDIIECGGFEYEVAIEAHRLALLDIGKDFDAAKTDNELVQLRLKIDRVVSAASDNKYLQKMHTRFVPAVWEQLNEMKMAVRNGNSDRVKELLTAQQSLADSAAYILTKKSNYWDRWMTGG